MLSLCTGDDRPFVLSTPRLEGPDLLHWRVPFDDPAIDDLFRLKVEPKDPQGAYTFVATLRQPDGKRSMELKQVLWVE